MQSRSTRTYGYFKNSRFRNMIQNISDQKDFLLVTIHAPTFTYRMIYLVIDKIKQIQFIAMEREDSTWCVRQHGKRTTIEALPKHYTVTPDIKNITIEEASNLCPGILNLKFSTRVLEDAKLRKTSFQQ